MNEFPPVSDVQLLYAQAMFASEMSQLLNLSPPEANSLLEASPALYGHWAVSVLGGDEAITAIQDGDEHRWVTDLRVLPLFAGKVSMGDTQVYDFREGKLAAKANALYKSGSTVNKEQFARLSKRAAHFTFTVGAAMGPGMGQLFPQIPQTSIAPRADGVLRVHFPGNSDTLYPIGDSKTSLERVVAFGPGLSGAVFGANLAGSAEQVDFVSGGKGAEFVSSIIDLGMQASTVGMEKLRHSGQLSALLSTIGKSDAQVPRANYHKKGIAASGKHLSKGAPIGLAVMSSVHSAGVKECAAGIEIVANNIGDDGVFILKAPNVSMEGEAGMDRMMPLAMRAFGSPAVAGACGTLQYSAQGKPPVERPASFAIFQK